MAEIKFSPMAMEDLAGIRNYIADELFSRKTADEMVSMILARIKQLESFPMLGPSLTSIVGINSDFRFLVCNSYTAFYRIRDDKVYIIRILYRRQNYLMTLFGELQDNK